MCLYSLAHSRLPPWHLRDDCGEMTLFVGDSIQGRFKMTILWTAFSYFDTISTSHSTETSMLLLGPQTTFITPLCQKASVYLKHWQQIFESVIIDAVQYNTTSYSLKSNHRVHLTLNTEKLTIISFIKVEFIAGILYCVALDCTDVSNKAYVSALNLTTGHREASEVVLCCGGPPLPFACLSDVSLG